MKLRLVAALFLAALVPAGSYAERPVPDPVEFTLGISVKGRPIKALEWNRSDESPALVFCGIHGDERTGMDLCQGLAQRWREKPEELMGRRVILIAVMNPDGAKTGTRQNARGVDLNRNFPYQWKESKPGSRYYSGAGPLSEPESQVLFRLVEDQKPDLIVSVHAPLRLINYDGPAREIALAMSAHNGYKVEGDIGYPTPGSFGTYAGAKGIPTITLELPGRGSKETLFKNNHPAVLSALHFGRG